MDSVVLKTAEDIASFTSKPEDFLEVRHAAAGGFRQCTKQLYDISQSEFQCSAQSSALPELIIQGFDEEQVWQELELHTQLSVPNLISNIAKLIRHPPDKFTLMGGKQEESIPAEEEDEEEDIEEDNEDGDYDDDAIDDEEDGDDESNDEDDAGLLSRLGDDDDDDDMSDEEKELKALLDKATSEDPGNDEMSDENDDDTNFELETNNDKEQDDVNENKKSNTKSKAKRTTVVDDEFFKMADMEAFLDAEDAREERKRRKEDAGEAENSDEEEEEDELDDEDDEGSGLMYADFFDKKEEESGTDKKRVHFAKDNDYEDKEESAENSERPVQDLLASSDSEGEEADDILGRKNKQETSSFEKRQEKLTAKITEMESASLTEKPWQLKGEVSGPARPENSLLEEDLDFDHTTRLAPQITEETTKSLEDIIKQRIKDKSWDDVERKTRQVEEAFEYKKRVVLDQEKSKQSLSQIYEQEYIKQQQKEEEEKEDPDHETIKKMMTSLFLKLDALSNYHYTPKAPSADIQIVSQQASIAMEEVAPVSMSEAHALAPEEVEAKQREELVGSTERTETDKKRNLRKKKISQRKRKVMKEKKVAAVEKARPGLGNKFSKEKALKELEKQSKTPGGKIKLISEMPKSGSLTSSSKFFSRLQDEVSAHVKARKSTKSTKQKHQQESKTFKL